MSNRAAAVKRLCEKGVVAVVRAASSGQLVDVVRALLAGGVECVEITMTTPNALQVIRDCRSAVPEAMIGVGSVLDEGTAQAAIAAGAQFVVSPVFCPQVVGAAHEADLPVVPGAMTPTEILTAHQAGADIVKVFPGGQFGPSYFRDILAPMPHLKLSPTGGVDLTTAADWIAAGAVTLGIGSALVTRSALASGKVNEITDLARQYVRIVDEARAAKKK
ncbi:MAG: bifunctional 4-hydroxy-2-oxoglutarate aldolase/2-dehydro-3-deoxy-phosphogluconate aldolase [Phycisphaerae bacterium]|nr:bifunctional 4-hydroxy-2-oxoglutarate aldolase/2-dehydro-3-deoxy-phosphogluconate aldolase [Phycisphaerae bacterium]